MSDGFDRNEAESVTGVGDSSSATTAAELIAAASSSTDPAQQAELLEQARAKMSAELAEALGD